MRYIRISPTRYVGFCSTTGVLLVPPSSVDALLPDSDGFDERLIA